MYIYIYESWVLSAYSIFFFALSKEAAFLTPLKNAQLVFINLIHFKYFIKKMHG